MGFTLNEILVSSLMGSGTLEQLPRLQLVQNEAMKRALPKIPFLPVKQNPDEIASFGRPFEAELWKNDKPNVENQFFPLSFRRAGLNESWYTLPWEPLINIKGSNEIIKRKVAKAEGFIGTVKERWTQNDYEITITGSIFGENMIGDPHNTYPREDFLALKNYMTYPKGLEVKCEPFQLLGINNIVVEGFSFPFTKGENVQAYEINAVSDYGIDFLLELP